MNILDIFALSIVGGLLASGLIVVLRGLWRHRQPRTVLLATSGLLVLAWAAERVSGLLLR